MRISGFHIDGFGVFHDQSVSGLDTDLIVFHGDNEAGKSTLLGFFRSVLFGFPRTNAKDARYDPLAGGNHGGRIDLVSKTGVPYSVFRTPGPGGGRLNVMGPDGPEDNDVVLHQLLGGMTREAYRNIYAFGLSELAQMDSLSGQTITSTIYGAGLGTAIQALPRARRKIKEHKDRLFKPGGRKPAINQTLDRLDQIQKARQVAQGQVAQYDMASDALARVAKDIRITQAERSGQRRLKNRYAALARLWTDWLDYRANRQTLSAMVPPPESFPEEGLAQLEALRDARRSYQDTAAELTQRAASLVNARGTLEESIHEIDLDRTRDNMQASPKPLRRPKAPGKPWVAPVIMLLGVLGAGVAILIDKRDWVVIVPTAGLILGFWTQFLRRIRMARRIRYGQMVHWKQTDAAIQDLTAQLTVIERDREKTIQALEKTQGAVRQLLETTGLLYEEDFIQCGRELARSDALRADIARFEKLVEQTTGETEIEPIIRVLWELTPAKVDANEKEASRCVQELNDRVEALHQKRAALKQELTALAASDEQIRLNAAFAQSQAMLSRQAWQWSRYALAGYLLDQAQAAFEKKHRPEIFRDSGNFFQQMTAGRYHGVAVPVGKQTVEAVGKHHERIPPDDLSRGTAEQLYLAIRFGFIRHRTRVGAPLPAVMDDILVNFDPSRTLAAARAIYELSRSNQVLFFTCHPHTMALFRRIDSRVPVFRLAEGEIFQEVSDS
ncbi:MAG: AAA family ATPase [Deltaproteobacteria bacterium]|nr:AAA family ATPase [Deltaproteobacteria bacterium]